MNNELRAYIREMISVLNDDVVFKTRQNYDLVSRDTNDDVIDDSSTGQPDILRHDLYEVINQLIAAYDILGDDYGDPDLAEILGRLKKETSYLINKVE